MLVLLVISPMKTKMILLVLSRTGHVICVADCRIVWGNKLQSTIALLTTEAEYNALSAVMREVIPLRELQKVIGGSLGIEEKTAWFKTTIWEDNQGCLTLANMDPGRSTPRSKHFAIKQHWFRSQLKPNNIEIKKIDTTEQKANIFTKGLGPIKFESERKMHCGW